MIFDNRNSLTVPKSSILFEKLQRVFFRFFKFTIFGIINYSLNIFIVWFCTEILDIYYIISVSIAYIVISFSSFFLNVRLIFHSQGSCWVFGKYVVMLATFYLLHVGFTKTLTDGLHLYYLYSVMISVAFLFLLKFFVYYKYVFTPHVES